MIDLDELSNYIARRLVHYMWRENGMAYYDKLLKPFSHIVRVEVERRLTSVSSDSPELAAARISSMTQRTAET